MPRTGKVRHRDMMYSTSDSTPPLMMAPACITSGLTQLMACSASLARILPPGLAQRFSHCGEDRGHRAGEAVELGADVNVGGIVGRDRKISSLEMRGREMLRIGQRPPAQKILRTFRHIRNHLQKHDSLVEMVEIIGGKAGARVDVGGAQPGDPRLLIEARLGFGSCRSGGSGCHRRQCWGGGVKRC